MADRKFRLVTRSDFDGLVCAVLLRSLDLIDDILFVHPKDMQDGKIAISAHDVTANLPYVEGCHLAFDHHASETIRHAGVARPNHVIDPDAPSAARVVFDHFGGSEAFPSLPADLMEAVDKGDSGRFDREEILRPDGWVLLNFLMDARTGLGRFREFRISNYQLMQQLIEACRSEDVETILRMPDVAERVELYRDHRERHEAQLRRCATVHDRLVVIDLRDEDVIYAGNRFVVYALFPECTTSIHVMWGLRRQNTVFALGNSVLNRAARTNVGALALQYGGGGHRNAGTCQVDNDVAACVLTELTERICANERRPVPADAAG